MGTSITTKNDEETAKRSSSSSSSSSCPHLSRFNKGAWTAEEDRKLARCVEIYGPRRWKAVAMKSGLNRCGKSCRLRWLNYLRPDIKRGNMSDAEDDLILRLHRLLGNRWSLIARRLPGRTDNEIKNYWNAHLRKKAKLLDKLPAASLTASSVSSMRDKDKDEDEDEDEDEEEKESIKSSGINVGLRETEHDPLSSDGDEEGFDFSTQGTYGLEWVKSFLELEEDA